MQDDTTTSEAVDTSQAPDDADNPVDTRAELEKAATTEAVEPSEDTSQPSDTAEPVPDEELETPTPDNTEDDAEIRDWAAKKNLPLDDPIKLAKMYRESEKALGKKGQEAGQLSKAVTSANEAASIDDIQALQNQFAALSFKVENNVDANTEQQMVQVLDEKPWLAGDLDTVLDVVRGREAKSEAQRVLEARKAGGKEALATAAARERAAPPKSSASTRETPAQFLTDEQVGELSPAEYAEAKADGKIRF